MIVPKMLLWKLLMFAAVFVCWSTIAEASLEPVTCNAIRYDSDTMTSRVRCNFPQPVEETKHDFIVNYHSASESAEPETLLMCMWLTLENITCKAVPGCTFHFVEKEMRRVDVNVSSAVEDEGIFACQLVSLDHDVSFKPCRLSGRGGGGETTQTPQESRTGRPIGTTETPVLSQGAMEQVEPYELFNPLVIGLLVVIVILLIFLGYAISQLTLRQWNEEKGRYEQCRTANTV